MTPFFPEDNKSGILPAPKRQKRLNDFQTPISVCHYMASLIPLDAGRILEPTPGRGNLLSAILALSRQFAYIGHPANFFEMPFERFDCVIMNPPFSSKYAFGLPDSLSRVGMRLGYHILTECMLMADNVIALMPWFTISDSDVRLRALKRWGIVSITALPRATFQYARIQTVVLQLRKGHAEDTIFKVYDTKDDHIKPFLFI